MQPSNLYHSLAALFPLNTVSKSQAASSLVCKQVIAANPIPSPEQVDADTLLWRMELDPS